MFRSALCLSLLCATTAPALASGFLDPGFDQDGVLQLNLSFSALASDQLLAGLIDAQGRYVGVGEASLAGDLEGLVVRFLPSGQRDTTFGDNGVVGVPGVAPFTAVRWFDVVEQPDGKLIVAGKASNGANQADPGRAYLCRILENGTLDPDFGTEGCAQPTFAPESTRDNLVAIALQPDGRILFTGHTDQGNDLLPFEYVVGRLESDGSYDLCFGDVACLNGGLLIEPEPDNDAVDFKDFLVRDIALAPDGRIVVAGRANGNGTNDMGVIRLLANGAVDVGGFGNGGHRRVTFDRGGQNADAANAVLVRADGSIVLAGFASTSNDTFAAVAALDPFGAPIVGFGDFGRQVLFFNDVSPAHVATNLLEQDDGKIVVVGYTDNDFNAGDPFADCGVARLLDDGELDPVFAFNGVNNLDSQLGVEPVGPDGCFDIKSDGQRLVLFGQGKAGDDPNFDSLLMRLEQDNLFRNGFEDPN